VSERSLTSRDEEQGELIAKEGGSTKEGRQERLEMTEYLAANQNATCMAFRRARGTSEWGGGFMSDSHYSPCA